MISLRQNGSPEELRSLASGIDKALHVAGLFEEFSSNLIAVGLSGLIDLRDGEMPAPFALRGIGIINQFKRSLGEETTAFPLSGIPAGAFENDVGIREDCRDVVLFVGDDRSGALAQAMQDFLPRELITAVSFRGHPLASF